MEYIIKQLRGQEVCPTTSFTKGKKKQSKRRRMPTTTTAATAATAAATFPSAAKAADVVVASPISPDEIQLWPEG